MISNSIQRTSTAIALLVASTMFVSTAQAIDVGNNSTDIWIRDASPTTTFDGTGTDFWDVRSQSGDIRYALAQFDLSSLSGTTVTSVELHIDELDLDDSGAVGSSGSLPTDTAGFMIEVTGPETPLTSTTWNTYQAEQAGSEVGFDTLGAFSLVAPGQSGGGERISAGSAADIATLQSIIDGSGILTLVLQPNGSSGSSFGDDDSAFGFGPFLRINDPSPIPSQLELRINRFTGVTNIVSTGGTEALDLDGYTLNSVFGGWLPANWNSLTDQSEPGWEEVPPASPFTEQSVLTELNFTSSTSVAAGGVISLGTPYSPTVGDEFVQFTYSEAGVEDTVTGDVVYEGEGLRLRVAKATGRTDIVNSEAGGIDFEGYTISSPDNDLNVTNWNSLESQAVPGWLEANPTSGSLSELNLGLSSVVAAGGKLELANAYGGGSGGAETLEFEFNLVGSGGIFDGVVEYVLVGDMNGDGNVDTDDTPLFIQAIVNRTVYDANDFATAAGYLVDADFTGDINGDGLLDLGDLTAFSSLLGGPASSVAVPEPSATVLLMAICSAVQVWRRRSVYA